MEVYTNLDRVSYKEKPVNEMAGIKCRIAEEWTKIEVKELADKVGNRGHTLAPGYLEGGRKAENCRAMQLFILDFDEGATSKEILGRCRQFEIPVTFAYHTFSSTEIREKFRVVFVYEQVLEDLFAIRILLAMLHRIFPECDRSCKNLDRMFFGGKGLIFLNENACISFVQLLTPFYQSMDVGNNFKRNIHDFCRKQKILLINDMPAMGEIGLLAGMEKIDGILDSAIVHKIEESKKSSFFVMETIKREGVHSNVICKEKVRRLEIKGVVKCRLLEEFNHGGRLSHAARFALCTNLLHINGGRKHFLSILEKHYDHEKYIKWKNDIRYMEAYFPHNCSGEFCPYYEECESERNIVRTLAMDRKIWREEETYYSLEEARECLRKNLEEAFTSIREGIHLIKAQTGLGKTFSYIRLIKEHPEAKFLIALPTNQLKKQVEEDISTKLWEDIFVTASVSGNLFFPFELREEIAQAHQQGFHDRPKKLIREYYESIKDAPDQIGVAEECRKLLEGSRGIQDERVILTTHALLTNLSEEFLKHYTVIIDEDILILQLMNKTDRISESCLKELLELGNPEYARIAAEMLAAKEGEYRRITGSPWAKAFSGKELEEIGMSSEDNVNDIAHAGGGLL